MEKVTLPNDDGTPKKAKAEKVAKPKAEKKASLTAETSGATFKDFASNLQMIHANILADAKSLILRIEAMKAYIA